MFNKIVLTHNNKTLGTAIEFLSVVPLFTHAHFILRNMPSFTNSLAFCSLKY